MPRRQILSSEEKERLLVVPDDDILLTRMCFLSWIGPYISIHFLSLNPLLVRRRRYSRGERYTSVNRTGFVGEFLVRELRLP